MADQPLEDLLTRLDRERQEADRRYNDALTALDRAVQTSAELPAPPRVFDRARVVEINRGWNILPDGPPPFNRSFKGRLRAFVWRLVGPPLETQKQFNASIVDHVNRNVGMNEDLPRVLAALTETLSHELQALVRFESLLVQYLQTITAYVDTKDRNLGGSQLRERLALGEQRILALKREFERMSAGVGTSAGESIKPAAVFSANVDSPTYLQFEDRFRGETKEVRGRVQAYVPILASASDVVDIGCGRGELLSALQERGVRARGVDANAAMVEVCRSRGLDVELQDALSYLERQPDDSVGGLAAIQVVEHFEPAYLARFLETAFHKMRPGAPLILETVNPACWMAFFETYIRDLTHQRPLHPDTLRYLVEASGFTRVDVQFRQPVSEADRLERVKIAGDSADALPRNLAQIVDTLNLHADKLNARLFSFMDYVVIARR